MAVLLVIGLIAILMIVMAVIKKPSSVFDNDPKEKNQFEGKTVRFINDSTEPMNADGECGHLEIVGESVYHPSFYEKVVKRIFDIVLSFCGLLILSPIYILLSIAIIIDDPGPIFFAQKRVGKNKQFFSLHKFRSMKMSTPHDIPTHMLERPDEYLTRVGRFLRKFSLDELPQIGDIFIGNMSIIGESVILGATRKNLDFPMVCGC